MRSTSLSPIDPSPAMARAWLGVRTLWSSLKPASQIGYQSRSASAPRSRPRRPSWIRTRSRSLAGHSSRRPYAPTASSTTPGSSPRRPTSHSSTTSAAAAPKARPPRAGSATSPRQAGRISNGAVSDRVGTDLARADAHRQVDRLDPQLAVADLAGAGVVDDGVGHLLGLAVVGQHL